MAEKWAVLMVASMEKNLVDLMGIGKASLTVGLTVSMKAYERADMTVENSAVLMVYLLAVKSD